MSKPHVHEMLGLKTDVLATYLTALGILRLVAEQKDPTARGFWRDEHFVLLTHLDWDSIERFLLEKYDPTPILAPWNLESGFFSLKPVESKETGASGRNEAPSESEDLSVGKTGVDTELAAHDSEPDDEDAGEEDEATGDPLIETIRRSTALRFARFQRAIEIALKSIPEEVRQAEIETQRAHQKMRDELAQALAEEEQEVSNAKDDEQAKKAAAKGTGKGDPSQVALARARTRLKQAMQALKQKKAELKHKEKELKVPIEDAKKRFKEIQSATKARLIADLRVRWGDERAAMGGRGGRTG